jgi:hypothetical protein
VDPSLRWGDELQGWPMGYQYAKLSNISIAVFFFDFGFSLISSADADTPAHVEHGSEHSMKCPLLFARGIHL